VKVLILGEEWEENFKNAELESPPEVILMSEEDKKGDHFDQAVSQVTQEEVKNFKMDPVDENEAKNFKKLKFIFASTFNFATKKGVRNFLHFRNNRKVKRSNVESQKHIFQHTQLRLFCFPNRQPSNLCLLAPVSIVPSR
jgi:hypothetical protein